MPAGWTGLKGTKGPEPRRSPTPTCLTWLHLLRFFFSPQNSTTVELSMPWLRISQAHTHLPLLRTFPATWKFLCFCCSGLFSLLGSSGLLDPKTSLSMYGIDLIALKQYLTRNQCAEPKQQGDCSTHHQLHVTATLLQWRHLLANTDYYNTTI